MARSEARTALGTIAQWGFVVRDLDAAIAHWAQVLGVGPFVRIADPIGGATLTYREAVTPARISVGFSYVGTTMIELLQPVDDHPSMFADFLAGGAEGLQHLAFWPDNLPATLAALQAAEYRVLSTIAPPVEAPNVFYLQAPALLGSVIELVAMTETRRTCYAAMRRIATSGDDPRDTCAFPDYPSLVDAIDRGML